MSIRSQRPLAKIAAFIATAVLASLFAVITPAGAQTPSSPTTNRIHGADRYATSVALARSINNVTDGLIIASGHSSADALAAATIASATRPVLLVPKDSIPASIADFIADYKASLAGAAAAKVYFIGGTESISAENYTALVSLITTAGDTTPPTFARLSGADRYATAAAIYAKGAALAAEKLIIVSGDAWADGISAAALSAESGWPVVLQTKTGNNASAKASIDAYLALPASIKNFVLIGGEESLSTDTEAYLINTKAVPIANIRRIHGTDRYATSYAVNTYMDAQNIGGMNGNAVALVSGESPWDALAASSWAAAKDSFVQLSPMAGGNASVAALGGYVGTLSKAAAVTNADAPGKDAYLIGGKDALKKAVLDGYTAGANNSLTSTLTGCKDGGKKLTLTLSGGLSTTENTAAVVNNEGFEDLLRLNSAAVNAAFTVVKKSTGVYTITTQNAMTITNNVPDTIKFNGVVEDTAFGGNNDQFERSIGASSCTVVNDTTKPVVTMRAVTGTVDVDDGDSAANPYWIITSSKPVLVPAPPIGKLTCDGATNERAMVATALTGTGEGIANTATMWIIHHGGAGGGTETQLTDAKVAAGLVCTLNLDTITDIAGNNPAANISATVGARDATGPTLTVSSNVCAHTTAQATYTAGNLAISAVATKAYDGAIGNAWKMTVTQQRGLLQPTITVDTTAKMITVTADTGYHTANDVAARWTSMNLTSAFSIAANAGLVSATVTPAVSIAGQSTCTLTTVTNEPATMAAAAANISVGGLDAGYVGDPAVTVGVDGTIGVAFDTTAISTELQNVLVFTYTTKAVGIGSLSLAAGANGLTNADAVVGTTPVTWTVN